MSETETTADTGNASADAEDVPDWQYYGDVKVFMMFVGVIRIYIIILFH